MNYFDRVVFHPVYTTVNYFIGQHRKTIIEVKKTDGYIKRSCVSKANSLSIAFFLVAGAVAAVAAIFFSLVTWPYRWCKLNEIYSQSMKRDLACLSHEENGVLEKQVREYIVKKSAPELPENKRLKIHANKLDQTVEIVKACYSRSRDVYAPVALLWVNYLLQKAQANNQKIVFMARDGTAPYKLALNIMKETKYQEKYPEMLTEGRIVMGYFSRKVVNSSYANPEGKKLFKQYMHEELGIRPADKCMFVDIGFEGSMIDKITDMASALTDNDEACKVEVEFEFLLSLTNKAKGFLADVDNQLASVPSAGANLGIQWLEDSHHGVINSPQSLIKSENGRVYPDTFTAINKDTCINQPVDFLLRKFSQRAITTANEKYGDDVDFSAAKIKFNETIERIKNNQLWLYITHK